MFLNIPNIFGIPFHAQEYPWQKPTQGCRHPSPWINPALLHQTGSIFSFNQALIFTQLFWFSGNKWCDLHNSVPHFRRICLLTKLCHFKICRHPFIVSLLYAILGGNPGFWGGGSTKRMNMHFKYAWRNNRMTYYNTRIYIINKYTCRHEQAGEQTALQGCQC